MKHKWCMVLLWVFALAPLAALAVLVLLWYLVYLTLKAFFRISTPAGMCMIPYLLWITFAFYLNLSVVLYLT